MNRQDVIQYLESLVFQRFNLETLNKAVSEKFGVEVTFVLIDDSHNDENCRTDFNLMGLIDANGIYCDVDIYYLAHRFRGHDEADFMVSGVGYEFE